MNGWIVVLVVAAIALFAAGALIGYLVLQVVAALLGATT